MDKVLISITQKELLDDIAYLAECMLESKNANNLGDAVEWERHLNNATDKYHEYLFTNNVEPKAKQS